MKLAIGYIRVSSQGQAAEGISLEAQEAKIKAWAEQHEYQVLDICRDNGISGFKLKNRPGAQRAIELACQHKAALVTYSLSRLCRSTKELITTNECLSKSGADLVSLSETQFDTTTAAGKFVFTIFAGVVQFERDLCSERTKLALTYVKSQGKRMGSIDYGYMPDQSRPVPKIIDGIEHITYPYLVECPEEQTVIAEIKKLKETGHSVSAIVFLLDKHGYKPRNGGKWNLTQIKRILKKVGTPT